MIAQRLPKPTAEEYLAHEEQSEERHEYFDGLMECMAGASDAHEIISGNYFAILHSHLRGNPCRPFKGDLKLRVRFEGHDWFYYPDIMVACDPSDNARLYRERPILLTEVLSDYERRDLVEKYLAYQRIPSLEEYVVLGQDLNAPEVRIFRRTDDWRLGEVHRERSAEFTLRSIALTVTLGDLYSS